MLTPFNLILYCKTGFYRGIHYVSSFCSKDIDCGFSLEPPRRGGSNDVEAVLTSAHNLFLSRNKKNIKVFYLKKKKKKKKKYGFGGEIFYVYE